LAPPILVILSACSVNSHQFSICDDGRRCRAYDYAHGWGECSLYSTFEMPSALQTPDAEGTAAFKDILIVAGVQNPPILAQSADAVAQAYYARDARGRIYRVISYDPRRMGARNSSRNWALFFALSHELGHHLEGHLGENEGHSVELQADAFASRVLAKLGASDAEIQNAIVALPLGPETKTHPARDERLGEARRAIYSRDPTAVRDRCVEGEDAQKCLQWADVLRTLCGVFAPDPSSDWRPRFWTQCVARAACYRRRGEAIERQTVLCRRFGRGSAECNGANGATVPSGSSCDAIQVIAVPASGSTSKKQ
jgi:hypothetical protein